MTFAFIDVKIIINKNLTESKFDFLIFCFQEEQDRKRKHTLTGEEVSSQFPEALVKSIQRIDEMPDRILTEDRWKFAG